MRLPSRLSSTICGAPFNRVLGCLKLIGGRAIHVLGEGIYQDTDGQFEERSTGIHSRVTDNAFVTMARLLNRPELLAPVRKNPAGGAIPSDYPKVFSNSGVARVRRGGISATVYGGSSGSCRPAGAETIPRQFCSQDQALNPHSLHQPGAANPGRAALALRQLRTVDRFHHAVPLKLRVDSSSSAILRAAPGVGSLRDSLLCRARE